MVYGKRPGSRGHGIPGRLVGYMPQETALYRNFSISEMLHHFGRLHNMNRKEILSREEFLLSFLDLPSRTRNISQLRLRLEFVYLFKIKKSKYLIKWWTTTSSIISMCSSSTTSIINSR